MRFRAAYQAARPSFRQLLKVDDGEGLTRPLHREQLIGLRTSSSVTAVGAFCGVVEVALLSRTKGPSLESLTVPTGLWFSFKSVTCSGPKNSARRSGLGPQLFLFLCLYRRKK